MLVACLPLLFGCQHFMSAVSAGQTPMMGVMASQLDATVPAPVVAAESRSTYSHTGVWVYMRGGSVIDAATSQFGSPFGYEYDLRLGRVGPSYLNADGTSSGQLRYAVAFSVPVRALEWNTLVPGHLTLHFGAEFGGGARQWWSDGSYALALMGARGSFKFTSWLRAEVDWTLAPALDWEGPVNIQTSHVEQRITATLGLGPIGIGARATFFSENSHINGGTSFSTTGNELSVLLEWRFDNSGDDR